MTATPLLAILPQLLACRLEGPGVFVDATEADTALPVVSAGHSFVLSLTHIFAAATRLTVARFTLAETTIVVVLRECLEYLTALRSDLLVDEAVCLCLLSL